MVRPLVVLLCLLLAGCSGAVRIAYDNADAIARWKADNYLQLDGPDSEELDERIDAFHLWHRTHALPQYAKIADEGARRMERGLSQGDLVWGYDSLVAQGTESLRAAAERLAPLLDRVGAGQVRHIERGFAEDNRKFAKEFLRGSEEERRRRRLKRYVERIEDWVGRLSDAQVERVRQFAGRVPPAEEMAARDRQRLQAGILDIVRSGRARERLAGYVAGWREGRDPAYAAASETWRREVFALALDLDRMLTPEQRTRAIARLRGYAADFAALAEKRAP
ncbi:MAG TPA: DUF6279 family lipoprotein [Burkholderiales bacterium]|nr:DUF6279 family lipoprotein [Burkholderiales bacterium]